MDGVLNVFKPAGMTSFDVIAFLRRVYGQKKIGHGGTLDPMAAGVLPVFLGKATRLIEYAPIHRKKYEAEFIMGIATDTEDMTGRVMETGDVNSDRAVWEEVISRYRGRIKQIPSQYSAIRVNGKRAYKLAREGEEVKRPEREVDIYHLSIRDIRLPRIFFSVECSSGTYIRALGRDIGKELGIPMTMSFLLRTAMGTFTIGEAKTLEEIEQCPEESIIHDIRSLLTDLDSVQLSEEKAKAFLQGKRIPFSENIGKTVYVFYENTFLGIAEVKEKILFPKKVFGESK